ncbi:unnamed protein product [Natator depressus]
MGHRPQAAASKPALARSDSATQERFCNRPPAGERHQADTLERNQDVWLRQARGSQPFNSCARPGARSPSASRLGPGHAALQPLGWAQGSQPFSVCAGPGARSPSASPPACNSQPFCSALWDSAPATEKLEFFFKQKVDLCP